MEGVNLTQLLLATTDANPTVRDPASKQLLELAATRFDDYVFALVRELANDAGVDNARMAAALQVKRVLTAEEEEAARAKHASWTAMDNGKKQTIKQGVIHVLATASVPVARQAAQAIEAIARLELADGAWNELPSLLIQAFDQVLEKNPDMIIGPLVALGYYSGVAADLGLEISEDVINRLLSKISIGMNESKPCEVQVAATEALQDTLDFAKHNMEREKERAAIMGFIFKMTQSQYPDARERAFQCLTTVLELYYHLLRNFMEQIWVTTTDAIRKVDEEQVAKQALNFWSEMCFQEADRNELMAESGGQLGPEEQSFGFVNTVKEQLSRLLLDFCLLQQDEEPDDDEPTDDTYFGAAEHCFANLCTCLKQDVVPFVLPFVEQNLVHADWRRRQAAIFAFGAILRDNDSQMIGQHINLVLMQLLRRMVRPPANMPPSSDVSMQPEPVASVRETAAWVVSQICTYHHEVVRSNQDNVNTMVQALWQALRDVPRVAHMAATAILFFAGMFEGEAEQAQNQLSGAPFKNLAEGLWDAARRLDSDQWQLMEDAYEALIRLIQVSAKDMRDIVGGVLLRHSLVRLTMIHQGQVRDPTGYEEVELCGLVSTCAIRLDQDILNYSLQENDTTPADPTQFVMPDAIMRIMLNVLNRQHSNAHADAFAAIAEVTRIVGPNFHRYRDFVMPPVKQGLQTRQNAQVCIAAVRLTSDICTAMESQIIQHVPELMQLIRENLTNKDVQFEVKPPHLTVMGDIAAAIGCDAFSPYFAEAMNITLSAANISLDIAEDEMADYLNELREAALESMELMLMDAKPGSISAFQQPIFALALQIAGELQDPKNYYRGKNAPADLAEMRSFPYRVSEAVIKGMLGVLGDVSDKMRDEFCKAVKENHQMKILFETGSRSENAELRETADYAIKKVGF
ncbi:Importin subunit beta-1 (Karyopherin subunit beta-1) (ATKPNB1) [Durusdinium trenchii]|uniref:Importin subunit beta-1 (Karyopherin subunit beta-1) (ATKPNB1) n=1 Tax=Durusdinium trenchii TaxID=1381693 RepID=A0ABP0RJU9_9DINO